MRISEFLTRVRGFTDYAESLTIEANGDEALTKWDYVLGVYGPTPVLQVRGSLRYIFNPLQAIVVGWDACHERPGAIRPNKAAICESLELSERSFLLLRNATSLLPPWNKQLRVDLIAACGLPDERNSPFFERTYLREYGKRL